MSEILDCHAAPLTGGAKEASQAGGTFQTEFHIA
jgi:hypothetical protein